MAAALPRPAAVLLLRSAEPSTQPDETDGDPYVVALTGVDHVSMVECVPVLSFSALVDVPTRPPPATAAAATTTTTTNTTTATVDPSPDPSQSGGLDVGDAAQWSGLIFTSARGVRFFADRFGDADEARAFAAGVEHLFCVGLKTRREAAAVLGRAPDHPVVDRGRDLGRLIVDCLGGSGRTGSGDTARELDLGTVDEDDTGAPPRRPLLYACGRPHLPALGDVLRGGGVPFNEHEVYESAPCVEALATRLTDLAAGSSPSDAACTRIVCCVFSPKGAGVLAEAVATAGCAQVGDVVNPEVARGDDVCRLVVGDRGVDLVVGAIGKVR